MSIIFLGFFGALDCILHSHQGRGNDMQLALMLSFYPVSIPQARGKGLW